MSQHKSLKSRRPANYGSTDTRVDVKEAEMDCDGADPDSTHRKKKKLNQIKSMNEFCTWIRHDPCSKLNIFWFFISMFIPFILAFYYFGMREYETTYAIAGIYGFLASLYGMNHFRTLLNLKRDVDTYQKTNQKLSDERQKMDTEVNKLRKVTKNLSDTHSSLQNSNLKMVNMIADFEALEDRLDQLNVNNSEKLSQIGNRADAMKTKYYDISLQTQRNILWKIFERLETDGMNKRRVTREDYKQFYELLPDEYKVRFDRLGGFHSLLKNCTAPNKSDMASKDFQRSLGVYAKMHVENADIVYRLDPIDTAKDILHTHQPSFLRNVTILSEKKLAQPYVEQNERQKRSGY